MTNTPTAPTKTPIFTEKVYAAVKQAAMYWLPGLATLYATLAGLWHFPYVIEVVGTIAGVDTFLGVLLGISAAQYNKSDARFDGALNVTQTENGQFHSLELNEGQYQALPSKGSITLKVQPADAAPDSPDAGTTDPRLLS